MISIVDGNIFKSTCDMLVNPVNCMGVSGAGLALQFKSRFPFAQKRYMEYCKKGKLKMGTVYDHWPNYYNGMWTDDSENIIVYFPTKLQPKYKSDIRSIYEGCISLRQLVVTNEKSVAIPALGCGLGELDFDRVQACVLYCFKDWPEIEVELYKPH